MRRAAPRPPSRSKGLDVYYGHSHALQGVDITLPNGVFSVVGRNGMGKTTLCKAIMGLVRTSGGSVRIRGEEATGLSPARIARLGVGYVPQGRRLWRSLSVNEHLATRGRNAARSMDHRAHLRDVPPAWPNARTMAAVSSPAANSRCSRSRARF